MDSNKSIIILDVGTLVTLCQSSGCRTSTNQSSAFLSSLDSRGRPVKQSSTQRRALLTGRTPKQMIAKLRLN